MNKTQRTKLAFLARNAHKIGILARNVFQEKLCRTEDGLAPGRLATTTQHTRCSTLWPASLIIISLLVFNIFKASCFCSVKLSYRSFWNFSTVLIPSSSATFRLQGGMKLDLILTKEIS